MSENDYLELPRNSNQARGLAQYAIEFMKTPLAEISDATLKRVELFHRDATACGISALSHGTDAPTILRQEALEYRDDKGATCLGSKIQVRPEKAILANASAVREWDSNGTVFGYDKAHAQTCGEFGHSDFYPVAIAAAQVEKLAGDQVLLGMLLSDEIRGRLAQAYSLKEKKIDHVVHGAIASLLTYGAMRGASVDELESAIGLFCAHYIPYRAIRFGEQLSDSKGASAAISTEVAIQSVHRAMAGFKGPADVFRNPQALWCLYQPSPEGESPFDLYLGTQGEAFAVMGMHFKCGLYEHQSASAIQGLIDLLSKSPAELNGPDSIESIDVEIYEPAYGIICDKAKHNPTTRQSADHSMPYITASVLKKYFACGKSSWKDLMLLPEDYADESLKNPQTLEIMSKVKVAHGGKSFDEKYPEGIPTSVNIKLKAGKSLDSGLVLTPLGHAANTSSELSEILNVKFECLLEGRVKDAAVLSASCLNMAEKNAAEIQALNDHEIVYPS